MRKKIFSISQKWTLLIGGIIVSLLIVGLIINQLFFYDYYLSKEKESMFEFAESLNAIYHNPELAGDFIDAFVLKKQASVTLYEAGETVGFSFGMNMNSSFRGRASKMNSAIILPQSLMYELENEGFVFYDFEHDQLRTHLMALIYQMENGDNLVIALPIEEISNTAETAIRFNVMIAAILILMGMIVVMRVAKRMTKPIIQLSNMTSKIANLDFSENFENASKDEIGMLGLNINEMSRGLETALLDLKAANEQLLVDLNEKDKIVEMRKTLIGNVSHELKTPIALIMGYTEGLKENNELDVNQQAYYLDVITKEAEHMDRLVRDLLNLTELEYDAFKITQSKFDVSSLIDEILDRYILLIANKNIEIQLNKEDIVLFMGDKKRMEQVLINLIVNALEHTPEGGIIKVDLLLVENHLKFMIYNSGSFVPEAELNQIWHAFYKRDNMKDRRIGGSGIGLSIVKAIIEKHKGTYGVVNEDQGVSFWFEI